MKTLSAILTSFLFGFSAWGACSPSVERALVRWDRNVAQMQAMAPVGKVDHREWVKKKLRHMVKVDQAVRNYAGTPQQMGWPDGDAKCFFQAFSSRWESVDATNTKELKRILVRHYWFFRRRWGKHADENGWLLVQHADRDRPFQIKMLKRLRMLYQTGGTLPAHFAYLHDRVSAAWSFPHLRRKQRYGTQGQCQEDGTWRPLPLEDPARVDEWRAAMGLGTMAEYAAGFKDVCR